MYVGLKQPRGDGERYVTPARAAAKETRVLETFQVRFPVLSCTQVSHVIFSLHLGVGHSVLLQLEGAGHVFSNNHMRMILI